MNKRFDSYFVILLSKCITFADVILQKDNEIIIIN